MSSLQNVKASVIFRQTACTSLPLLRSHQRRSRTHNQWRTKHLICALGKNQGNEAEASSDASIEELEARLGVRRKARREAGGGEAPSPPPKPKAKPKAWDEMSLPEQAWNLYIGETGVLFWLNKLAYASIFLIIGGWIAFRFIGPALGWYELDSPLLPPSQVLAGSAGR